MEKFHANLKDLKEMTISMAKYAFAMLRDGMEALKERDIKKAHETHERRHKLQDFDSQIEEQSLKLLTLYQPVAGDLRLIGSILKINSYLNRIGRYGKDIAQVAMEFEQMEHFKKLVSLTTMTDIIEEMFNRVLNAFKNHDVSEISPEKMEDLDNQLDEFRYSVFRECISYMMENPRLITPGSHYIMVARYLERCGDHICRFAEKIHYIVLGKFSEIR